MKSFNWILCVCVCVLIQIRISTLKCIRGKLLVVLWEMWEKLWCHDFYSTATTSTVRLQQSAHQWMTWLCSLNTDIKSIYRYLTKSWCLDWSKKMFALGILLLMLAWRSDIRLRHVTVFINDDDIRQLV